jgi:hypothetical protein
MQLPTLYFAVLMTAHLLDHFIFSARRLTLRTKWIAFGICAGSVLFCFWWFKAVAFGIDGPITEHKGLLWRKVCPDIVIDRFRSANVCVCVAVLEYIYTVDSPLSNIFYCMLIMALDVNSHWCTVITDYRLGGRYICKGI